MSDSGLDPGSDASLHRKMIVSHFKDKRSDSPTRLEREINMNTAIANASKEPFQMLTKSLTIYERLLHCISLCGDTTIMFSKEDETLNRYYFGYCKHVTGTIFFAFDSSGHKIGIKINGSNDFEISSVLYPGGIKLFEVLRSEEFLDSVYGVNTVINGDGQSYREQIYYGCPTYVSPGSAKYIDCQVSAVTGKLLIPVNTYFLKNKYPPIIYTCITELAEEWGIIPKHQEKLFFVGEFDGYHNKRHTVVHNYLLNIADCIPYSPDKLQTTRSIEDYNIRVQIAIFGTENAFTDLLFQINERKMSKDFNSIKGIRLIPIEHMLHPRVN